MIQFDKILNVLARKDFQDPSTGNLFFPVYIYTYDTKDEALYKEQIPEMISHLSRPSNHLHTLHIDIWKEIMTFFEEKTFGKFTFLELIKNKENTGEDVTQWVRQHLFNSQNGFFIWLKNKIDAHYRDGDLKFKPYIIVNGFTEAFPYMRPGEFLKNTESLPEHYKIILFYPGKVEGENFKLFGTLESESIYRANILNNMF
jgi:hypothetical protein